MTSWRFGSLGELAEVKTIAGFLNTAGGTLFIGVADDVSIVGLGHDNSAARASLESMSRHPRPLSSLG